jgi:hypothetical protein
VESPDRQEHAPDQELEHDLVAKVVPLLRIILYCTARDLDRAPLAALAERVTLQAAIAAGVIMIALAFRLKGHAKA